MTDHQSDSSSIRTQKIVAFLLLLSAALWVLYCLWRGQWSSTPDPFSLILAGFALGPGYLGLRLFLSVRWQIRQHGREPSKPVESPLTLRMVPAGLQVHETGEVLLYDDLEDVQLIYATRKLIVTASQNRKRVFTLETCPNSAIVELFQTLRAQTGHELKLTCKTCQGEGTIQLSVPPEELNVENLLNSLSTSLDQGLFGAGKETPMYDHQCFTCSGSGKQTWESYHGWEE